MTAAERRDEWADVVLHAARTLRRHLDDPDPARSMMACVEVLALECTRLRHGRPIAGTEGADEGDGPWERSRDGRANAEEPRRDAEPAEVTGCDGEGAPDLAAGAAALRELLELPDELDPSEYAAYGLAPDGRPSPAALGGIL